MLSRRNALIYGSEPFFHMVRAAAYWLKIHVTSTPVHACGTGVSQGGRVQTIAGLETSYALVTSKLQHPPHPGAP